MEDTDITILLGVKRGQTIREIGEVSFRSPAGVLQHLRKLEEDGYVVLEDGKRYLTEKGTKVLEGNGL